MPLKIAAPCSINACSTLRCPAGVSWAALACGLGGAAAGIAPAFFARESCPAIREPLFNSAESQEVSLLLTGRRRCFGNVPCALVPTCFNVERGCCWRNLWAAVNTVCFSCVVQKTRDLAG